MFNIIIHHDLQRRYGKLSNMYLEFTHNKSTRIVIGIIQEERGFIFEDQLSRLALERLKAKSTYPLLSTEITLTRQQYENAINIFVSYIKDMHKNTYVECLLAINDVYRAIKLPGTSFFWHNHTHEVAWAIGDTNYIEGNQFTKYPKSNTPLFETLNDYFVITNKMPINFIDIDEKEIWGPGDRIYQIIAPKNTKLNDIALKFNVDPKLIILEDITCYLPHKEVEYGDQDSSTFIIPGNPRLVKKKDTRMNWIDWFSSIIFPC